MRLADFPLLLFLVSLCVLWISTWLGLTRLRGLRTQVAKLHDDFAVIQGATLTLLGLIIGFTFSMAMGRYDLRKNYEEEEANAIGTEYVRADLLPAEAAAQVRELLRSYLDQRILFYTSRWSEDVEKINARTAELQDQLWRTIQAPAAADPNPVMALVVSGMNDVLNRQGYTQAAWWNRIPVAAWCLLATIGICSMMLVGLGAKAEKGMSGMLLILPVVVSIAFFLIADLDCPSGGVIRVEPQNLYALADSLWPR